MSTRHFDHSSGAGRDPAPLWLAATPLAFFLPANASQSVAARFPVIESLDPAGRQGMRPGHLQRAPSHSLLMGGGMALDKPGRTHSPAWLTFPLSLNRVSDSERLTGRRKCTSVMRATAPRLVQHGDSRRDGTHLTSPARWMGFCWASDTQRREPGMSSRDGGWKPGARDSRRDGTHLTSPARWMGFCRASDTRQREPGMSSRDGGGNQAPVTAGETAPIQCRNRRGGCRRIPAMRSAWRPRLPAPISSGVV